MDEMHSGNLATGCHQKTEERYVEVEEDEGRVSSTLCAHEPGAWPRPNQSLLFRMKESIVTYTTTVKNLQVSIRGEALNPIRNSLYIIPVDTLKSDPKWLPRFKILESFLQVGLRRSQLVSSPNFQPPKRFQRSNRPKCGG